MSGNASKVPSPLPCSREMLPDPLLAEARSGRPSPSKSAMANDCAKSPMGRKSEATKVPSP